MQPTGYDSAPAQYITANDRMKQRASAWLPRSIVAAVVLHVALFSVMPTMTTADTSRSSAPDVYIIPPPVKLPPAPEPIARPAAPVVGSIEISDDITIPSVDPKTYAPELMAPPARSDTRELKGADDFVVSSVMPRLLNAAEVERELTRSYPPMLRDVGIGGTVDVNLWLDETGAIVKAAIGRSSGYDALDQAALRVVGVIRLAPAQNRGRNARVIVTLPVVFKVR